MPRKPATRTLQLLDGLPFRIGARTQSHDLHGLVRGCPMDCVMLHVSAGTACVEVRQIPGGTPGQLTLPQLGKVPPTPVVNPGKGWNARVELPGVVALLEQLHQPVPPTLRRMARHVAAMPKRPYPWATGEARGFPAKPPGRQTLWVVDATGACWLEQEDATAGTPQPPTVLVQLSPTVAAVWMLEQGYADFPAAMMASVQAARKLEQGAADDAPARHDR